MKLKEYIDEALTLLHIKGEWQNSTYILEKDFLTPKQISRLTEYIGSLVETEIMVIDNNLALSFYPGLIEE